MPINPSVWSANFPITAHQLNQDLYTYDGSYFGANGVLFHSNRPLLAEAYTASISLVAPQAGEFVNIGGTPGAAVSVIDNSALFGIGADFPGDEAIFLSLGAGCPGSSGFPGYQGGWELVVAFIPLGTFSSTSSCYGMGWQQAGVTLNNIGVMQPGSTVGNVSGFALDLIERSPTVSGVYYGPTLYLLDPNNSVVSVVSNTASTVGLTPRFMELWCGALNGTSGVVTSVPSPLTAVTSTTQFSAATLNNSIKNTLTLLNNPPMLNCQLASSATAPSNTRTVVPFAAPLLDNYSGFNNTTSTYTVPLDGLYLVHLNILMSNSFTSGQVKADIVVNGTTYAGGAYNAVPATAQDTGVAVTKILDLHAGDTVQGAVFPSTGTSLGSNGISRFVMVWMSSIATSTQSWSPPDVSGFQFQAGTSPGTAATQLAGIMNTKIANDFNFLLNRPYCTVHQTIAQTALTSNVPAAITMDAVSGLVHGSNGDNYGGWSTANNYYVAQVPGWYLAVSEIGAATVATTNSGNLLAAGFSVPTSGGITSPTSPQGQPDLYQKLTVANNWSYPSGATAVGCYYLSTGETIAPSAVYYQGGSVSTWATDASFHSHFNVFWVSN